MMEPFVDSGRSFVRRLAVALVVLSGATGGAVVIAGDGQLPPAASQDWWSAVQQQIAAQEYHLTWQEQTELEVLAGAWQAPNRAQGFRTYFTTNGIQVVPRGQSDRSWLWGLSLVAVGRPESSDSVTLPVLAPETNRIEYRRGKIVEWYVNSPEGLEQGFTIDARPPGDGRLLIDLELTGTLNPRFSEDHEAIDFIAPDGGRVLHYADLKVTDARDRELPAWFEGWSRGGSRGISIVVDDGGAVFPVVVDPLATNYAASIFGRDPDMKFGYSVAPAGDVDGDRFGDVVVGAPDFLDRRGAVFVHRGSPTGLETDASWSWQGDQPGDEFGRSVATAGDVNGDGYSDIIVSAPNASDPADPQAEEGMVRVYTGSASGLTESWEAFGDQVGAHLANQVATAGDVNGDGFSDIIAGTQAYDNGHENEGLAVVWHGGLLGLGSKGSPDNADWRTEGGQIGAFWGSSVATAGDVNGDGYSDVAVGANWYTDTVSKEGAVFVYHGSPGGLSTSPAWSVASGQQDSRFGGAVACAGDVDGDGFSDLIVGAWGHTLIFPTEGAVFTYLGSGTGLQPTAQWSRYGDQEDARMGLSVGTAGDVNGDGYSDIIFSAYLEDDARQDQGRAFVHHGTPSGVGGQFWERWGGATGAQLGRSVSTAGDVNGDGFSDIVVGAPGSWHDYFGEGRILVFHGGPDELSPFYGWWANSDQADAQFGFSVAAAGDVDGDGYGDIIVGARLYDNGQSDEGRAFLYQGSSSGPSLTPDWTAESNQSGARFGWSVASAGDTDGDGYSDVIIGAPYFDFHASSNHGAAFLWRGGSFGLGASGEPGNADWRADGQQANAYFGYSVRSAGDVNGDGFLDVIVGAPYYDDGQADEGGAFVWFGADAGLGANGVPANADWRAHSNQAGARFGASAGPAGDVNGDGVGDIVVGAYLYDDEVSDQGALFVWHGAASGLGPEGTPANADFSLVGAGAEDYFGVSVATAGDVNGDGYSDVIAGAHGYDYLEDDVGRAYVFHGSQDGTMSLGWLRSGLQEGESFGYSVASAGDVNGDGYADVVVGGYLYDDAAPDTGVVTFFPGSESGLADDPTWYQYGLGQDAWLGRSVASAGDVNGDGYADILVGSPGQMQTHGRDGAVHLYYGNGRKARTVKPEQRLYDGGMFGHLIDHLGRSDRDDAFKIAVLGHGLLGRGDIRLEWEVKPVGMVFNGTGLNTAGTWTESSTGDTALVEPVTVLNPGAYHWRARVAQRLTTSPFQPWGRWLTQPWGGWNETDLRIFRDDDGDGVSEELDNCPDLANPGQGDLDGDGTGDACDPDRDGDSWDNDDDCAPDDADVWAVPSVVRDLLVTPDETDNLDWTGPEHPGSSSIRYDVLVSERADDWSGTETECVESNGIDTAATHTEEPKAGQTFHYLVRAENGCGSNMGSDSKGAGRTGRSCP